MQTRCSTASSGARPSRRSRSWRSSSVRLSSRVLRTRSGTDGVPGGLELRERLQAAQGVVAGLGAGADAQYALDRLGREHVQALAQLRVAARVDDRVEVAVRAERGGQLVAA